jgi:hypothetical protein
MGAVGALVFGLALAAGCSTSPPRNPDDICDIFGEKRSWYRSARHSFERWGVPESVQLAVIHQESRFESDARPPRKRILWILPGPRLSSANGYGQALDRTWREYQRSTGNRGADRDDFADVTDFIGWYGQRAYRRAAVPKSDAYRFYLAYHEGPDGYLRGSWKAKHWLQAVAREVAARAGRYQRQYLGCRERLAGYRWWWPF